MERIDSPAEIGINTLRLASEPESAFSRRRCAASCPSAAGARASPWQLDLGDGSPGRSFGPAETLLAQDLADRAAVFSWIMRAFTATSKSPTRGRTNFRHARPRAAKPLAAIQGAGYVLRISEQTPDKLAWAQGIIDRQVNQLVRLVDPARDVARITQGKIRLQLARRKSPPSSIWPRS